MDGKEPFERLREAREKAGFERATHAASALGMKTSSYLAHENGQNKFRYEHAVKYAKKFKVKPEWLMSGEGDGPSVYVTEYNSDSGMSFGEAGPFGVPADGIPEIDLFAGMGGGGLATDVVTTVNGQQIAAEAVSDYWRVPAGFLAAIRMKTNQVVAIPVKGDSNEPTIRSTDIVFIDVKHKHPSPDGFYALADLFGEIIVKRITRITQISDPEPKFEIRSDNPNHPTRIEMGEDLRIMGRVVFRMTAI